MVQGNISTYGTPITVTKKTTVTIEEYENEKLIRRTIKETVETEDKPNYQVTYNTPGVPGGYIQK